MRAPSPEQVVRLLRQRPIQLVPSAAPKLATRMDDPCGFCEHPRAGHGTRYSTFGGAHKWLPRHPGSHITPLRPIGDEP